MIDPATLDREIPEPLKEIGLSGAILARVGEIAAACPEVHQALMDAHAAQAKVVALLKQHGLDLEAGVPAQHRPAKGRA